jgi:hypothetical protein
MASVTGTVSGSLKATITNTSGVPGGGSYSLTPAIEPGTLSLANGTGSNQIDVDYFARLTPGTSGSTVDLSGTLTDPLANTSVFAEVAAFQIENRGSNSIQLAGNFFSTNFGGSNTLLPPSGGLQIRLPGATGYAVANGASDVMNILGVSGTSVVDIGVLGRSA